MTARSRFSQSDVTRLLKAAKASGYACVKLVVTPEGTLEIYLAEGPEPWPEIGVELEKAAR